MAWDFNIFLSESESRGRQKINTDIEEWTITLNQLNLIDIYVTLHPQRQKIHSFQANMEHLWRWAIKQVSMNLKGLASYIVYFLTEIEFNFKSITIRYMGKSPEIGKLTIVALLTKGLLFLFSFTWFRHSTLVPLKPLWAFFFFFFGRN